MNIMKTKNTELVKTTLRLPKKIFQEAKIKAVLEERNLQELVAEALETYLKKKGSKVKKGYVIGKVNRKLIFEATKNSKHINPLRLISI